MRKYQKDKVTFYLAVTAVFVVIMLVISIIGKCNNG